MAESGEKGRGGGRRRGKSDAGGEVLCRRCGVCCHEKIRIGDLVVITEIPCRFLDPGTNLCRVYPRRLGRQPRCSTAAESIRAGSLPGDCPYVRGLADYRAPYLLSEHPEYETAVNALFAERKCAKST
ncbi:MAG: hypothetical protein LBE84_00395 [Planctomycetota bacterium]|jgi:uncharacterized cysteine cluster protein YcgN (CxxCxxCC family)|nr:hypothetical protein [Planctomycetota bacterium]